MRKQVATRLCGFCLFAACLPSHAATPPPADAANAGDAPARSAPVALHSGVLASLRQRAMTWLPHFSMLGTARTVPALMVPKDNLQSLGEKYGIHIAPSDPGYVYLDVLRKISDDSASRSTVQAAALDQSEALDRAWQPTGLQDLSKPDRNSLREVRFVPQLIVNVNEVVNVPGQLQFGMTYRSWNCPETGALPDIHPVPQMSLRWTYR